MRWQIGDIYITPVVEIEAGDVIQGSIKQASDELISENPWLKPNFIDQANNFKAVVQVFLIETKNETFLLDSGIGNDKKRVDIAHWGNLRTDFLDRLNKLATKIDRVIFTHLHFDHVGWNTRLENGVWVPVFPNSRHLIVEKEFNYWKSYPQGEVADDHSGIKDSIMPVFEAGLVDLVPEGFNITDEISLIPTPGHTPGHSSILIESKGQSAVITGDVLYHPIQFTHPEWEIPFDTDKTLAAKSRQEFCQRFADSNVLVIGTHFSSPTAGHIKKNKAGFKFDTQP